jgi:transcriptional regulator with XRE-family HTH domain
VLKTPAELLLELAARIRTRRSLMGWSQMEAARRAGIPYRTWRRLETEGGASTADMVKAAVALRCEEVLSQLFPPPAAASLDALLADQAKAAKPSTTLRPRAKRKRP